MRGGWGLAKEGKNVSLGLSTLGKKSADDILKYFPIFFYFFLFFFFTENRLWHFMQIVSLISMKCQNKRRNILSICRLLNMPRVVNVNSWHQTPFEKEGLTGKPAYFRLNGLPHCILEEHNFDFRCVTLCDLEFLEKMAQLFANSRDPDQTPHSAASDLGLHCLPIILLDGGLQTEIG